MKTLGGDRMDVEEDFSEENIFQKSTASTKKSTSASQPPAAGTNFQSLFNSSTTNSKSSTGINFLAKLSSEKSGSTNKPLQDTILFGENTKSGPSSAMTLFDKSKKIEKSMFADIESKQDSNSGDTCLPNNISSKSTPIISSPVVVAEDTMQMDDPQVTVESSFVPNKPLPISKSITPAPKLDLKKPLAKPPSPKLNIGKTFCLYFLPFVPLTSFVPTFDTSTSLTLEHSSWKSFKPESSNNDEKKKLLPVTRTFQQTKPVDDTLNNSVSKEQPNKKQKMEDQITQTKIEIKQVLQSIEGIQKLNESEINAAQKEVDYLENIQQVLEKMNSHEETIKELAIKINIQNNAVLMLAAPSTTNEIAEIEAMFGVHHV